MTFVISSPLSKAALFTMSQFWISHQLGGSAWQNRKALRKSRENPTHSENPDGAKCCEGPCERPSALALM